MDEDEMLRRFGLSPAAEHLDQIRDRLSAETARERRDQGTGDTEVMRLCCVQLFNAGRLSDVVAIWRAKSSSWDASRSIEVRLLCGGGLAETKAYLRDEGSDDAARALDLIRYGEDTGDFVEFSVETQAAEYRRYYGA